MVIKDPYHAQSSMEDKSLNLVVGGASISGSLVSAVRLAVDFIYDLGRKLGSAIRRYRNKTYCA